MKPLVYTIFITNNHALFGLWWMTNLVNIKRLKHFITEIVSEKSLLAFYAFTYNPKC